MRKSAEAKKRLLDVVINLIMKEEDLDLITVREIAEAANANPAMINYYYQSKDNLVFQAASVCMQRITDTLNTVEIPGEEIHPVIRLKKFLMDIGDFVFRFQNPSRIAIKQEMISGNIGTGTTLMPILREIYQGRKAEVELKIIALQIVTPFQIMFLNADVYQKYLGIDLNDKEARSKLFEYFIDNIICEKTG